MTPAERTRMAKEKDMVKHRQYVVEKYREMRAVVRCGCGYSPAVLREMDWEALRQAYSDVMTYNATRDGRT